MSHFWSLHIQFSTDLLGHFSRDLEALLYINCETGIPSTQMFQITQVPPSCILTLECYKSVASCICYNFFNELNPDIPISLDSKTPLFQTLQHYFSWISAILVQLTSTDSYNIALIGKLIILFNIYFIIVLIVSDGYFFCCWKGSGRANTHHLSARN